MITPQGLFNLLSDETRLRCLFLLHKEKELCVCELGQVIGSVQPKISRHLALLRQSGLVSDERRGQWVYYRFNEALEPWIQKIIVTTFINLECFEPFRSDIKKLHEFQNRNPCIKQSVHEFDPT